MNSQDRNNYDETHDWEEQSPWPFGLITHKFFICKECGLKKFEVGGDTHYQFPFSEGISDPNPYVCLGKPVTGDANSVIFMGNGSFRNGASSTAETQRLHLKLERAIYTLSGRQQNGGMGYPFVEDVDKMCENEIRLLVRDIAVSLGVGENHETGGEQ